MFQATFRGRELLYPQPFGKVTAGADKDYPVDYSHLNIMGYALGAKDVELGGERYESNPLTIFPTLHLGYQID